GLVAAVPVARRAVCPPLESARWFPVPPRPVRPQVLARVRARTSHGRSHAPVGPGPTVRRERRDPRTTEPRPRTCRPPFPPPTAPHRSPGREAIRSVEGTKGT